MVDKQTLHTFTVELYDTYIIWTVRYIYRGYLYPISVCLNLFIYVTRKKKPKTNMKEQTKFYEQFRNIKFIFI